MSTIPTAPGLPTPTAEELARSQALIDLIRHEMAQSGASIPFRRYMELALYAPDLGFYSAPSVKFGAPGDFVTAPELGSVFARCLARQCAQLLEVLKPARILEVGAGSGALALDLLGELAACGRLPEQYLILELSRTLRARQQALFASRAPQLLERVQWLDRLPANGFRGIVLGNELLDAMPADRFRVDAQGVTQWHVGWEHGRFAWHAQPAAPELAGRVSSLSLPVGYESELGLSAEAWVRTVSDILAQGVLLLVDYGFPAPEFYHPQRHRGTLMCHYRHRAHDDPLLYAGLQDITVHVDFTAIARAGMESGMRLLGYTSQAQFLLGCDLATIGVPATPDPSAQLSLANEIKKLTLPQEMGELFKVIAFGRDVELPLQGFRFQNRIDRLSL